MGEDMRGFVLLSKRLCGIHEVINQLHAHFARRSRMRKEGMQRVCTS